MTVTEAQRGSVKYEILRVLWDGPRHGYDIMRTIESERGYRPSPGSVYPSLQMLEEGDFISGAEVDGKRVYTITDKGSEMLARYREAQPDEPAPPASGGRTSHFARGVRAIVSLKLVLKEIAKTRDPDSYAQALGIIERARCELYGLLNRD